MKENGRATRAERLALPSACLSVETRPNEGLRWRDLQDWWAERENLTGIEAKRSLYKRLLDSLPANSPAQRSVFTGYARHFGSAVPDLPALLPEVWLHWDPKTVKE